MSFALLVEIAKNFPNFFAYAFFKYTIDLKQAVAEPGVEVVAKYLSNFLDLEKFKFITFPDKNKPLKSQKKSHNPGTF